MGCVTSKLLKKQAINDGWTPSPTSTMPKVPTTFASSYSVECYHRHHFVSLTSTSYGSLKVEPPKPPEARLTHDRATIGSLNDMYGTLRSLEMAESAHDANGMRNYVNRSPLHHAQNGRHSVDHSNAKAPSHAVPLSDINRDNYDTLQVVDSADITSLKDMNIRHNAVCPDLRTSPMPSSPQWSMNSAELGLPETINVKEMMMGLEEAVPLSQASSPAKRSHSTASTPRTKALQQNNQHLKRKAEGSMTATQTSSFKKGVAATYRDLSSEDKGVGKENTSPLHGQHFHGQHVKKAPPKMAAITGSAVGISPLSQIAKSSFRSNTSRRDACSLTPLSQVSHHATMQTARDMRPLRREEENTVARKAAVERGSSFTASQTDRSSPGLSSTSTASAQSVYYLPSNGKVKLTLRTQHHWNDSAAIIHTPSPPRARSMSRRPAFGGSFPSADPASPAFDPELVASYEKVLSDVSQVDWDATHVNSSNGHQFSSAETGTTSVSRPWLWSSMSMPITELDKRLYDPLQCFEKKCPPGGGSALVLYTTTLRGIRKTFEDCNTTREILQSFCLNIDERDVSMHLEFLNELRELMGRVVSVPRMFIKGRYIGGIEEVVKLHEEGKLSELVEGLPKQLNGGSCDGCGGVRFVPCLECSGSCKLRLEEDDRVMRCPDCNENGLIQCPICT